MDKWIHNVVANNIIKGKITKDEAEIYEFGYSLMFEKMIIFVITIVVALLFDAIWEVLALCITFIPLRVYSGGYHAKRRWGCMMISGMFLVLGVQGARLLENFMSMGNFMLAELICSLVIGKYAPVDVEERKINNSERVFFKKKVMIVVIIEILLGILFLYYKKNVYVAIITISCAFSACSLVVGFYLNRKNYYN